MSDTAKQTLTRSIMPRYLRLTLLVTSACVLSHRMPAIATEPPDVLFIVIDDLNDWIKLLDPDAPIATPNLQRLADRGVLFTSAYCASPACNPSRTATLTGMRPTSSGVYGNKSDWRGALPDRKTIFQHFRESGYRVQGAGKIFHHHYDGAFHDPKSFDQFQPMRPQLYPPKKLNGADRYGSRNTDWGQWPLDEADAIDTVTVDFCVNALLDASAVHPRFIACGIFKPHSPFFAPAAYHRPVHSIKMPVRLASDWDDLPAGASTLLRTKRWFWQGMMDLEDRRPGAYREFVQSYAACVAFADHQVGRLLDALDTSGRADDTVIVLWSDHGFHLGEKDHIEKFALWEKTNHVPLIFVAPGITTPRSHCARPVDLTAIYPTLLECCGLPADDRCDGRSLVPLLREPTLSWNTPALMTYLPGNHAVRSQRWRYIRYKDGSEELYDHESDPNEWRNLASQPQYAGVRLQHRQWLPQKEAAPVADLRRPDK